MISYDSPTYTRIKTQFFHRRAGEGGEGWPGSCGEAEGLHEGGGSGWQRRTVVFHSHYRNVLPCALVAPRNKSSVTVTMLVGEWRGTQEGDEHGGVIVAPQSAVGAFLPTICRSQRSQPPFRSLAIPNLLRLLRYIQHKTTRPFNFE